MAQLDGDTRRGDGTNSRKAELEVRREPLVLKHVSGFAQFLQNVLPVELDKMRQHETVMQRVSPVNQFAPVRFFPESGDQRSHDQLLGQAHARVGRHFKGPQFDQPEPGRSGVGWIKFVDANLRTVGVAGQIDQKVAEDAVDRPGRYEFADSASGT